MEFNTKKIQAMGKALAEEMKRCGFSSDDNLYEVENTLRELQRQIGQAGLAEFLEEADDELHEEVKTQLPKMVIIFTHIALLLSGASSARLALSVIIIGTKMQKKGK